MKQSSFFSESDLESIENAVKRSETGTSGEIVPVFVEKSGTYQTAIYKGVLGISFLVFLLLIVLDRFVEGISIYDPLSYFFWIGLAGLITGLAIRYFAPLQRGLTSNYHLDEMTFHKANQFFLKEEVFKTRDRTGIMIFVSWFEHRVVVMADKGISKVVKQDAWDGIVKEMVSSIKAGNLTEGMIKAIDDCADLLRKEGINARPDDTDELSNKLRTEG